MNPLKLFEIILEERMECHFTTLAASPYLIHYYPFHILLRDWEKDPQSLGVLRGNQTSQKERGETRETTRKREV